MAESSIPTELKEEVKSISGQIKGMIPIHHEGNMLQLPDEVRQKIKELMKNSGITLLAKTYVEFDFLQKSLNLLAKSHKKEEFHYINADVKDSIEKISADNFLMDVIKSSKNNIETYNSLVDVYDFCKKIVTRFKEEDRTEIEAEKEIMKSLQKFASSKRVLSALIKSNDLIEIYNHSIDLYNHFKKKQEMYDSIRLNR